MGWFCLLFLFLDLLGSGHQTGKHCETHLLVDLYQVVRESVHTSSDLPGHGDGVLGIGLQRLRNLEQEQFIRKYCE